MLTMMLKLWPIFVTVFLAELGDKTQLATMLFATDKAMSPWLIFLASAGALTCSSGLAVLAGNLMGTYLQVIPLKLIAGLDFVLIGAWTIWDHFQPN